MPKPRSSEASVAASSQDFTSVRDVLLEAFNSGKTRPLAFRSKQLQSLRQFLIKEEAAIAEALYKDLHRPTFEASSLEVSGLINDIDEALKNLKSWMAPTLTKVPPVFAPALSEIHHDPFGVCLILCPFNYPFFLTIGPLIGAIAGGNCAVIKPSEMAPASERLIHDVLPRYIDSDCYKVLIGDYTVSADLLKLKWDKIFFTGSTRVGKIVMKAAAEHLTPVSLELGGKSPTIVDKSVVDMDTAAKRIIWGKGINFGQTCVAPDYLLVHEKIYDKFVDALKRKTEELYSTNQRECPHLSRAITPSHFSRIKTLLDDSKDKVICGGKTDEADKFIEVTLLADCKPGSLIMQEEIFGPLLPILKYSNTSEIYSAINAAGEKPLALYIFASNQRFINELIEKVPSGGVVVNDCLVHFANVFAPFGGIGGSGMGGYHGKFSFEEFTFKRAVLRRDGTKLMDIYLRYPPYSDFNLSLFKFAVKLPALPAPTWRTFFSILLHLAVPAAIVMAVLGWVKY